MPKVRLNLLYTLLILTSMIGCVDSDFEEEGMRPIYESYDKISEIKTLPARPFEDIGKIVNVGDYIYINERDKGVHVIDNKNPSKPVTLCFWAIKGNTEFTINENVLYANHGKNLFVIDISDIFNIKFLNSIKDIYEIEAQKKEVFPPNYIGWFECYDSNKGFLIGWEESLIKNPNCKI